MNENIREVQQSNLRRERKKKKKEKSSIGRFVKIK